LQAAAARDSGAQPARVGEASAPVFRRTVADQQTVDRLRPVIAPEQIWILTNDHLRAEIVRQLPRFPSGRYSPSPRSEIPRRRSDWRR